MVDVDMIVVFSTGTLALVSSATAVVVSLLTGAVGVVGPVAFMCMAVVFADVITGSLSDVANVVILVEITGVVLVSAKVNPI